MAGLRSAMLSRYRGYRPYPRQQDWDIAEFVRLEDGELSIFDMPLGNYGGIG